MEDFLDSGHEASMRRVEQGIEKFNHRTVMKKLDDGRSSAERMKHGPAPKTGYLDTQLFPDKKAPAAYEEDYSTTEPKSPKGKV